MNTYQRAYGRGALIIPEVLDAEDSPAGLTLETAMTFAAADTQVMTSEQGPTNGAAESIAFTSGSEKPTAGDTLTGATSTETCVVIGCVVTSGTWAGGTAAGWLFAESVSGVFQSENLNNTTSGTSNVMTIGGDFDGFAARPASNSIAVGLTSTEMTCEWAKVEVVDATATEVWLESAWTIETYGHPSALHQPEGNWLVLVDGVVGGTGNDTTHVHLDGLTWGDDEVNHHMVGVKDISTGEWHARWADDYATSTELVELETALPFTPVSGDLWAVLVFRRDTEPRKLGGGSSGTSAAADVLAVIDAATVTTNVATMLAALVPVSTTIATLSTQTTFTLTAGSTDNDAYNGWVAVVQDASTSAQYAVGVVEDYVGSTKTVTLAADPGIFTMATSDKVRLIPPTSMAGILAAAVGYAIDGEGTSGTPWGPA